MAACILVGCSARHPPLTAYHKGPRKAATMPTLSFTIEEVTLPDTVDSPDAADFVRSVEISNAVEAIDFGTPDTAYEPEEALPYWKNPHQPTRMLVAKVDGEVVATASYETQVGDNADSGWLGVDVLPEFRGHGLGTALADEVERMAAADGKAKALVYTGLQDVAGERIPSPTGFGSIPAEHRDVRFLLARGYRFEQVERFSRLPYRCPPSTNCSRPRSRRADRTTSCTPMWAAPRSAGARTWPCSPPA